MQHYQTLQKRFAQTGVNIAVVNRFVSAQEITKVQEGLKNGTIDIVVGTHKLLNPKFQYKDLGLLIIDEEQRFGVEHKEKMKEMKHGIDVLSLSATPIPRTMQMSLIGVRTISQLNTPPAHRHPVQTYVLEKRASVVKEVIQRELARNGQVFYLYNRVQDIYGVARHLDKQFPEAGVRVVHGKMNRDEIEDVMMEFSQGKFKILVCTTIIETGLDIENANTMIIENADHFGLSQLYQIRGRVGRREKIAYCYLMVQPKKELTEEARKRLRSIREFTQLGSGYKVAMRDLTIRGAGDLLGPQQAGFIDQVGLDLYLEMLASAIAKRQGTALPEKTEEKTAVSLADGYIPNTFASEDGDKLELYQDIRKADSLKALADCEARVQDLFGHIPKEVRDLFKQRQLDLFVNTPGVESLKDTSGMVQVVMSEDWSKTADGMKLFESLSSLSRDIRLRLKAGKIEISYDKKNRKALDYVLKTAQWIEQGEFDKHANG